MSTISAAGSGGYYPVQQSAPAQDDGLSAALREEGLDALREAKAAHDQLEALYHPHVDFAGVQQLAREELERIESYL